MDVNASIFSLSLLEIRLKCRHMKKPIIIVSILGLLGASGAIIAGSAKEVWKGAEAYSATTSLPTTIDLNDSTSSEIRNYYSSLNGLSSNELKGTNLLKNLKPILKNGQTYYSYDYNYGTVIWQMYEIVDRDWEKSPADHITYGTYNSSTNKITNYQYGTNSNQKNNPYLHALYVNRNVDNQVRAWGNHNQDQWGINREHVWAKSHGMGDESSDVDSGGARGDLMHLWSGNGYVNGFDYHGNLFYGFVNKNSSYSDAGSTYSNLSGNLKGYSASMGSGSVFEPQDSDKGDIARIIFYMAARYNYFSGSDSDGIDANNPNLEVVDRTSDTNGTSKYDSSTTTAGQMGVLRDLLAWNRLDPPDEWEIHRNNLMFKNYSHNRNPFVDFPEWAEYVWGSSTLASNQRSVTSYSSTPTGSANPSSDNINTFEGQGQTVEVTSVEVFPSSVSIEAGQSNMLSAEVLPANATNKSVTWSSTNSGIVSVNSNGIFTGHVAGTAKIRATANNGVYGECNVTVTGGGGGGETVTTYELVTDGLHAGDEVVIGAQSNWTASSAKVLTKVVKSNYYLTPESATVSNGVLTKTDSMPVWTVSGTNGSFKFENDGDYLYGIKNVTSTKTYYNIYANGTSSSDGVTWTANLNSSNTGFDLYNDQGVYVEYYGQYDEFTGYSKSANEPINFYRKTTKTIDIYTAEEFSTDFLASITCNNNGESTPTLSRSWSELAALFAEVDSAHKTVLVNADANENGDVIERAMARYDLLCRKYSQFNNFIGRASANPSNSALTKMMRRDHSLALAFSIVSGVIVIGVIVLITLRKKKII